MSEETKVEQTTDAADDSQDSETTASPNLLATEADKDGWEWWTRLSIALAGLMGAAWIGVFAKLGITSVQIHAMVIPTLGALTLPFLAWGLIQTLRRPPALRRSRTIAFLTLLATGYVGNVPLFAAPVQTDGWASEHEYLLPFEGEWTTLAGGPELDRNYHATTSAIRWGYDFAKVKDGKKFELDGAKTEDFYCFDQPVLAPASGKVVVAENDVVDNDPRELASDSVFGNHVVIKVDEDEYLFVAHMKKDSVTVKAGDEVEQSELLGKCGNSGRSIEPHVHVHLQDRRDFPIAMGLPLKFSDFTRNGKSVKKGMPRGASEWDAVDGDVVSRTD